MSKELNIVINEHNKVNITYITDELDNYEEKTESFISNPGELSRDLESVINDHNDCMNIKIYIFNPHLYIYDMFKLGCLLKDDKKIMIISL